MPIERHTSPALFPPPGYAHAVVSRAPAVQTVAGARETTAWE